jgi:hypothetical protein
LIRSANRCADVGHSKVDDCAVGGAHGFEFLFSGGHCGFDRGDFA